MESRSHPARRFLIVYAQSGFWSMGEGIGAGSFWRTPRALVERGHEVHFVLPAPLGQAGGHVERDGLHLHFYASPIDFVLPMAPLPVRLAKRFSVHSTYQRIGLRSAMAVAEEIRPDIVLAFGTFEAPVAYKVARAIGVPNVTRLFGNSLSLTLGDPIRFHLNFPEVRAFKTPCARLILTNDGADGEKVARRCGVPPDRFVHLRNGLDFEMFKPGAADPAVFERLGLAAGTPILMTVTRLAFEKKLERVIDAMPVLLARAPNAVAVLVGEGPERSRLETRAQELGVAHAVLMPGAVANRDLPAWYRSAAIVLSLLDRTNASNPVFEAMACERCVVALDTGTTGDLIVDGQTGVLVRPRDLGGLGATLADLVLDLDRRARLGAAARAHVRSLLLDPAARMDQEVAILLQVIEEARRR